MNTATREVIASLAPVVAAATARAVTTAPTALDAGDAKRVAAEVVQQVAPVIVNQTNQEPAIQSTVTWGAVIAGITAAYAMGMDFHDGTPPTAEALTGYLGAISGAVVVIYGRWFKRAPLGQ